MLKIYPDMPLNIDTISLKQSLIIHADCFEWMEHLPEESLHAIVTDPPYGVKEYDFDQRIEMAVFGVFHPLSMDINVHLCPDLLP